MREEFRQIDLSHRAVRRFGAVMAVVGALLGVGLLWRAGWRPSPSFWWTVGLGTGIGVLSVLTPSLVRPLYRAWMLLAIVLGYVMTRVILALVFFLIVTPTGLIMRMIGRDPLSKRPDQSLDTYWIEREQVRDADAHMRQYY